MVVASEMVVLLEVGAFDVDRGVEMNITIQERDFGGIGVPCKLNKLVTIEAFKELGEGVRTIRPEEEVLFLSSLYLSFCTFHLNFF
jgi:hypothetical protein